MLEDVSTGPRISRSDLELARGEKLLMRPMLVLLFVALESLKA